MTVTLRWTQLQHATVSSHLFAEPAEMFNVTAKWDCSTVVIRRISAIADRWQLGIHVSDGECRQWRYDVANSCQPLHRGVFIGTTQQTRAATVRWVQLHCHWVQCWAATVHKWTVTATHLAQSQWNCSLGHRRRGRRLGIISPANITQQWRRCLAEVRRHLSQILHYQQSTTTSESLPSSLRLPRWLPGITSYHNTPLMLLIELCRDDFFSSFPCYSRPFVPQLNCILPLSSKSPPHPYLICLHGKLIQSWYSSIICNHQMYRTQNYPFNLATHLQLVSFSAAGFIILIHTPTILCQSNAMHYSCSALKTKLSPFYKQTESLIHPTKVAARNIFP